MKRERLALTRVRRRLRRIAAATARFAAGQYDQRLEDGAADEIGQIEAHLNQVAEQLVKTRVREKILVEQNARLEEQARLSRDLHESVRQQIFALAVQIELARSLLDQDRAVAREHLDEADELANTIVVIDHGLVIAQGTAEELKSQIGGDVLEFVVPDRSRINDAVSAIKPIGEGEPHVEQDTAMVSVGVGSGGSDALIARRRTRAASG